MPDLQHFARVQLTSSGPVVHLARPGFAAITRDPAEVQAWARRWPEHYLDAWLDFAHALAAERPRNPTVATVDEALTMARRFNQEGAA